MSNISSIHGALPQTKERNESCVRVLESLLERAKSGEIIGVAGAAQEHDGTATYHIGGYSVSFSMLGALHITSGLLQRDLTDDATD